MKNNLLSIANSMIIQQAFIELRQINEETLEYGLKLSEKDIKTIIEKRSEALNSTGRAEFGGGIIKKLVSAFCTSPYIHQYNYVETISDLIDTFYYYKNETLEMIGDDQLIDLMKYYFDKKCHGEMELLRHRYLYALTQNIKYGVVDYLNLEEEDCDLEGVEEE